MKTWNSRSIVAAVATVAFMAAALVLPSSDAGAAASSTCGTNDYCLYKHFDYNDAYSDNKCINYDAPHSDYDVTPDTWFNCSTGATTTDGMDNDLSSLKNRSGTYKLKVFEHDNYLGAQSHFGPGVWDGDLTANAIGDNRMSSFSSCVC